MKVTLNWLKEFVDITLSPKELADKLTLAGLEVEGMETVGAIPSSVITVKIEKIQKHPNADRLTVCDVSLGGEKRTIVCGAKNMKEGDVVALAQPGSLLPDGKKIERSKIRDVLSDGMLCSEKELGLAEESEGIMILPSDTVLGKSLTEILPLFDTIFEINVTPNRPDCLSVLGIAREVSALTGQPLKSLSSKLPKGTFSMKDQLRVEVKDKTLCPRYTARMIRSVKIGPSPFWVQLRLKNVGLRSINNVVDATNYVMIERGQPLHAFDGEKIAKKTLLIERQAPPSPFKTLDEIPRSLEASDLLISDPEKILAIAGVMGGLSSGVSNETRNLVLESAYFDPSFVRKTSKRLGLMTESSYRFERGVDPNGSLAASDRLAELILSWAGGEISEDFIDTAENLFASKMISLRSSRVSSLLGYDSSHEAIEEILSRLQLKPKKQEGPSWVCEVPTYRRDLEREIDLVEEVARVAGYDKIPALLPMGRFRSAHDHDEGEGDVRLRRLLQDRGLTEVIHYSFGSEKEILEGLGGFKERLLKLSNPLSEELAVMRPSLVPSMLQCLQRNFFRQNEDLRLFELRKTYHPREGGGLDEKKRLCFALSGKRHGRHWASSREDVDFYDGKGILEEIWQAFAYPPFEIQPSSKAYLHPGKSAEILVGGQFLGDWGVLHPALAVSFDLNKPIVIGEICLSRLSSLTRSQVTFKPLPKFPSIERDLTVVVPEALEGGALIQKIRGLKIPNIRTIQLFDIYRGKPIEEGKKALTYFIQYQDDSRTLTDDEVNQIHTQMVETLKTLLPIEWR